MGLLDGAIQPILYACYAVYVLMGIALLTMGAVYMGETGATGSTGGSLLFLGGCSLHTLASPPPHTDARPRTRAASASVSDLPTAAPAGPSPGRPSRSSPLPPQASSC